MAHVTMPQLGETVAEGTVVRWLKKPGQRVDRGEALFEVATDKVSTEIPSIAAGVLTEVRVEEGQTVAVGAVLAVIAEPGAGALPVSPVVRRLAAEHGVDLGTVAGSGRDGRVTREDVLAAIAARDEGRAGPAPGRVVRLSPLRRRIAERMSAAKRDAADAFSVMECDMEAVAAVRSRHGPAFREREGFGLSYLPFVACAVAEALAAVPALNATIDDAATELTLFDAVHLGIAVDRAEQGLIVPVLHDVGGLGVTELARRIRLAAERARANQLPPHELSGSTFTITNNGSFGTLFTAPIINRPNVATLSLDVVEPRAVAAQGAVTVRHRTHLCMTWDHRALDGAVAGAFLARVKANLQTWEWEPLL